MKDKINLKDVEKMILEDSNKPIEIGEINGKKIIFNPHISCLKMFNMCKQITKDVLDSDGTYLPQLKDILIFYFMVESMTNIPIRYINNESLDIDFIYQLMNSKPGETLQSKFLESSAYDFLSRGIEEQINFKKSNINSKFENIDKLINEFYRVLKTISSLADEHKNLLSSGVLNKMIETLEKVKSK